MKLLKEQYKEEVDCYNTLMNMATDHIESKNYGNAAVYLEDAAKSLKEIDNITKQQQDLENGKVTITVQQLRGEKS